MTNSNTQTTPLVSIGLPIVKKEFLTNAITCCLNQTYSNIEVIILNNAPTESLRKEIEEIVLSFDEKNLKYFKNESQIPIIENWNKVLRLSTGEYFSLLCDDDYWDDNYIESMILLTRKYPQVSIFHARTIIVDESNKLLRIASASPEYEDVLDFIYNRIAKGRDHFLSDFLVKTSSIKDIGGFIDMDSAWGSDDLTWFLLAKDCGVVFQQMPLYYYRESGLSVTNNMPIKNKIKVTEKYFEKIRDFVMELPVGSNEILSLKKTMILDCWENCRKSRIKGICTEYLRERKLYPLMFKLMLCLYRVKTK